MSKETNLAYAAALAGLFGIAAMSASPMAGANDQNIAADRTMANTNDARDRQTRAHFDRLDTNKDGRISQAELDAETDHFRNEDSRGYAIPLSSLDGNADGVITRDEWDSKYFDLHGAHFDRSFRSGAWDRPANPTPPQP